MKRKIREQYFILAAVAILLSVVLVNGFNYTVLEREVIKELKTSAHIMGNTVELQNGVYDFYDLQEDGLRVTVIEADGSVVYDNQANAADMGNHKDRREVKNAIKNGRGQSVRQSATLGRNTYYYAERLPDGKVLRLSKESKSIWSTIVSTFPITIGIILCLILLSAVSAHLLTKRILRPIEQVARSMDSAQAETVCTYKELQPFLEMIQKQHADILKNAEMRQEFTANVSHELKTPLTSVSGYAELIMNGMATDSDVIRFAREIHANAQRLLTLINDIIRLSELDVSTQEVVFEQLDLYQMAGDCVNMLGVNAENHGVTLSLSGGTEYVYANREMMNELLYNLCDNAIRYNNPGGSVAVSVAKNASGSTVLCVKDTGIGISKEHQERIFERFYRVDKSRSKSTGGTGLGLAIVKHIVAQHNATLRLESEQGRGTLIEVTFCSRRQDGEGQPSAADI